MTRKPTGPVPTPLADSALLEIGLRPGDRVRFRRREGGAWQEGRVECRERDGSVGIRDERGSARALPTDRLQIRTTGKRGRTVWEPVADRASRDEQLGIFDR
ncbi:MAG: hypothetical protein Q8K58_14105 [Acidimicrobiales bacterium]|nr:hypothetical protein [Acidimicrobiales bacterium]